MLQHTPADSTTYAAKPQRTEVMEVTMKLARLLLPTLLLALATAALYVPTIAQARSFPDVAKSYWDYGAINWVTNQGPAGAKLLDDYAGAAFKPNRPLTREQLAAALVTASGHLNDTVADPQTMTDLPGASRYCQPVQVALALHLFSLVEGSASTPRRACRSGRPTAPWCACSACMHPQADWSMLSALQPAPGNPTRAGRRAPRRACPGRSRHATWACATTTSRIPPSRSRPTRTSTAPRPPTCSSRP